MHKIYWFCIWLSLFSRVTIQAQTLNFQSATPTYPDRALAHTYTNVGSPAVDVSITITGPASFGNNTPKAAGTGLTNQPNFSDKTSVETYTFTFSKAVTNLSFNVSNIDQGNSPGTNTFSQDQLTISAVDATNSTVLPTLTTSPYYTVSGNTITATATNNATVGVSFPGSVKTLRIQFGNGPSAGANPSAQGFTIGTLNWSGVLPVTLLSFTARPEGSRVQLAWATTAERDADRFVVERSPDLSEFMTIGEVAANGTTDQRQFYGLTDPNPQPGINYYRLKQVDRDGTPHFFKPVAATVRTDEPEVSVYPNPASADRIHLRLWNADGAVLRLQNSSGQLINGRLERSAGAADWLPDSPLPVGLYLLDVQTNRQKRQFKVLIR